MQLRVMASFPYTCQIICKVSVADLHTFLTSEAITRSDSKRNTGLALTCIGALSVRSKYFQIMLGISLKFRRRIVFQHSQKHMLSYRIPYVLRHSVDTGKFKWDIPGISFAIRKDSARILILRRECKVKIGML